MMTLMDLPPHYSGITRVLSAGNSILFPSVLQSVQVVDPIGIEVVRHALESDELLALATNSEVSPNAGKRRATDFPEGASAAHVRTPIYRMVCLARIVEYEEVGAGYSMSILGIRRAWIRRQVPTAKPFRLVDLQVLSPNSQDVLLPIDVEDQKGLSKIEKDRLFARLRQLELWERRLRRALQSHVPSLYSSVVSMQRLLDPNRSLETLTDLATSFMRLPLHFKLQQLQCVDSLARAIRLVELFGILHAAGCTVDGHLLFRQTAETLDDSMVAGLMRPSEEFNDIQGQPTETESGISGIWALEQSVFKKLLTKMPNRRVNELIEPAILNWDHKAFPGGKS